MLFFEGDLPSALSWVAACEVSEVAEGFSKSGQAVVGWDVAVCFPHAERAGSEACACVTVDPHTAHFSRGPFSALPSVSRGQNCYAQIMPWYFDCTGTNLCFQTQAPQQN